MTAQQPTKVSQADLARLLNVTRQSINELVGRGILKPDQDGRLDLEASRAAILDNLHPKSKAAQAIAPAVVAPDPAAAGPAPAPTPAPMSYNTAKTLREVSEAAMAQLKLQELRGELVKVADVRTAMAAKVAALREAAMQIPSRLAPVLAAETDQAKVYEHLENELRAMLAFVADESTGAPTIH